MNRAAVWFLGVCLLAVAQDANAQGLLGKPYVSAQYLLFRAGDDFEDADIDADLGHGGRIEGNIPLIIPDDQAILGFGIDGFGRFSGLGFDANLLSDPSITGDVSAMGADVGVNFYAMATENIRPFVQIGVNWTRLEFDVDGGPTFDASDTEVIFAGGVEVDIFPFAAVRASYGQGADGFGDGFDPAFLGEVILHSGDHWFGRFSASVTSDKTVIGGFGAGFMW